MPEPPGVSDFVRVLGPVQLVTALGTIVDIPSASQRRLMAVLALHGRRSVRASWLADVLGVSPGGLRNSISRLRRVLGDDLLVTTAVGYRLDIDVDADRFFHDVAAALTRDDGRLLGLDRALAMWTGPAFGEFECEAWAVAEVAKLNEIHASASEERCADLITACRWAEAVASLSGLVARHPFRDRPRGLLISALAGAGRQADALRAYQEYRAFLAEEVGTEPSAEVREIERRVAAGWNGVDTGADRDTVVTPLRRQLEQPPDPTTVPLHGELARNTALVGRSRELDLLAADLAQARVTGMRSAIVAGEAGIGKTTLIAAFARELHDSLAATVLYGRCDEGSAIAMQPFVGLVRWLVEHAPIDLLGAHVARCGGDLLRIAPHLADRLPVAPSANVDEDTERYLLFEAVADLLRRMARRQPVVVILDDLHWAEPTAIQLLRSLSHALVDAPLLLIVAFREPGEPRSDELRTAIAGLERGHARRLGLAGFDAVELADLVASVTTASPRQARVVAERLRHETGGNPLYASHLLQHWVEADLLDQNADSLGFASRAITAPVPPSLRNVLWSRVRALGSSGPATLSAAAVLGLEFSSEVLIDILDLGEAAVTTVLDDAIAAGLLVEVRSATGTLRFTHSLVASAAYDELHALQRTRLHQRAARALRKCEDAPAPAMVGQLARHCELGGLVADALRWASDAGDLAAADLAQREAADWYRRAIDHATTLGRPDPERADLLVRLGEALHRAGDPLGLQTLYEGADLAQRCGARATLVRAALASDRGFVRLGALAPEQLKMVEAAVEVADQSDIASYTRLLALFGQSLIHTPDTALRQQVAKQAIDLATASIDPMLLPRIARAVVFALWGTASSEVRTEVVTRALAAAELSSDPFLQFGVHHSAYLLAIESADADAAARSFSQLRTITEEVGEPRMRWLVGILETFDATMAARLDDAERIASEMFELGSQIGESDAFSVFAGQFFVIGTFAGRHGDLFPLVERAATDNPEMLPFRLAYAVICSAVGRLETAQEILAEGMTHAFANVASDMWWMTSVIGYTVLAIELEDRNAAELLLAIIEPFSAEVAFNGATSHGPVSAYVGKLASLLGRHECAESHLRAALATDISFGWEYHRATTLFDLARTRFRRDRHLDAESVCWLNEAAAICGDRGIRSWAARIDTLRRDAGVTR